MRKSQAILEVVLVFIIGLFLFFGIMGIWMWGDSQIAKRQPAYNQTRTAAGTVTQNTGQSADPNQLNSLIAQRDTLQAMLNSMGPDMGNSAADLEASKVPVQAELDGYLADKVTLETERATLVAEETALQTELAQLQRTCFRHDCDCFDRMEWIPIRLAEIQTRITEIDNRINNVLMPEINRLQGVIDQVDAAIAALQDDTTPAAGLQGQINSLNALIADLQAQAGAATVPKDLYWPVYTPDILTEEDVFGVQE